MPNNLGNSDDGLPKSAIDKLLEAIAVAFLKAIVTCICLFCIKIILLLIIFFVVAMMTSFIFAIKIVVNIIIILAVVMMISQNIRDYIMYLLLVYPLRSQLYRQSDFFPVNPPTSQQS